MQEKLRYDGRVFSALSQNQRRGIRREMGMLFQGVPVRFYEC